MNYEILVYVSATLEGKLPDVKVSPAEFCQVPDKLYSVPTNLKLTPVFKLVRLLQL